jgi:hypothetical protein
MYKRLRYVRQGWSVVASDSLLLGGAHTNLSLNVQKGFRVKFVLLTNPNNPLGVIYHPDVIHGTIRWARKRSMHTIVDEIYALSTHKVRRKRMTYCTYGLPDSFSNQQHFVAIVIRRSIMDSSR